MPDHEPPTSPAASKSRASRKLTVVRWASLALILAAGVLLICALPTERLLAVVQIWIDELGMWGPLVLGAIYILATLLFIPGSALTLVAAAIYGVFRGMVIVSLSSTIAAALAFLIARYFARAKVRSWIEQSPKLMAVDAAIGEQGWKIVALLRLSPVVPFNLQNYLYGVTAIRFWPCVLTSWVAMLPGTFMYVYLGSLGGAAAAGRDTSAAEWGLRAIGLLATIVVSVYIARVARTAIKQRTAIEANEDQSTKSASSSNLATDSNTEVGLGGRHFLILAAAVILFVLSLWAFAQREAVRRCIESLLGAPPADATLETHDTLPEELFFGHWLGVNICHKSMNATFRHTKQH